jgi:hypothetical protein
LHFAEIVVLGNCQAGGEDESKNPEFAHSVLNPSGKIAGIVNGG